MWWHAIVPTNEAERTGYPTEPGYSSAVDRRAQQPGDHVLNFFAGSGTTGEAALGWGQLHTRRPEPQAVEVMLKQLERYQPVVYGWDAAAR